MSYLFVVRILLFGPLGGLLALAYFSALGWNVRLYVNRGIEANILLIHLGRLSLLGAALTLFARQGALPLLSSVAGFQVMRTVAINRQLRLLESAHE